MIFPSVIISYVDYINDFYDECHYDKYQNFSSGIKMPNIEEYYDGITKIDYDILSSMIKEYQHYLNFFYSICFSVVFLVYLYFTTTKLFRDVREYRVDYLMGFDINENGNGITNGIRNDNRCTSKDESTSVNDINREQLKSSVTELYERLDKNINIYNLNFTKVSEDMNHLNTKLKSLNDELIYVKTLNSELQNNLLEKNTNTSEDIFNIKKEDIIEKNNTMSSDNYHILSDSNNLRYDIIDNLLEKWNNLFLSKNNNDTVNVNDTSNNKIIDYISDIPFSKLNGLKLRRSERLDAKKKKMQ